MIVCIVYVVEESGLLQSIIKSVPSFFRVRVAMSGTKIFPGRKGILPVLQMGCIAALLFFLSLLCMCWDLLWGLFIFNADVIHRQSTSQTIFVQTGPQNKIPYCPTKILLY